MAENRRVERRSIIGNGNVTDPETIADLEEEWERRVRGHSPKPKKKFRTVVEETAQEVATEKEDLAKDEQDTKKGQSKENLPKTIEPKLGVRLIRA